MNVFKLTYDDFEEDEISWLAIHTSLLSFRIAYFLNKNLKTHFRIVRETIKEEIENIPFEFTHFDFYEKKFDRYWKLAENKSFSSHSNHHANNSLFNSEPILTTRYIIPDIKNADYILKIENPCSKSEIQTLIQKINDIPQVSLVYQIPIKTQKSKNNLLYKV